MLDLGRDKQNLSGAPILNQIQIRDNQRWTFSVTRNCEALTWTYMTYTEHRNVRSDSYSVEFKELTILQLRWLLRSALHQKSIKTEFVPVLFQPDAFFIYSVTVQVYFGIKVQCNRKTFFLTAGQTTNKQLMTNKHHKESIADEKLFKFQKSKNYFLHI